MHHLGVADATRRTAAPPPDPLVELPSRPARLRVLAGPQADAFTSDALDTLHRRPTRSASNRIAWGSGSKGRGYTRARR